MALAKRRTKALPLLLLCHDVNGGVNLAAKLKEAATGYTVASTRGTVLGQRPGPLKGLMRPSLLTKQKRNWHRASSTKAVSAWIAFEGYA